MVEASSFAARPVAAAASRIGATFNEGSWQVDTRFRQDLEVGTVRLGHNGAFLSIKKRQSQDYFRVVLPVGLPLSGPDDIAYISFTLTGRDSDLVEWVALLESGPARNRLVLAKARHDLFHEGDRCILKGYLSVSAREVAGKDLSLGLQLSRKEGELQLRDLRIFTVARDDGSASPNALKPAAATPTAEAAGKQAPAQVVSDVVPGIPTTAKVTALNDARKLVLKVEKAALGYWKNLQDQAAKPLDAADRSNSTQAVEIAFAKAQSSSIKTLQKAVAADITTVKRILGDLYGSLRGDAIEAARRGADFQTEMRASIASVVDKASCEHLLTPYFARLVAAVDKAASFQVLAEAWRTLQSVDMQRYGHRPRAEGPLVSIIMPVLNREKVVLEAVNSVLAQTYKKFELLICNDASEDGTQKALGTVRDGRVRVLKHKERKGAAAARNTCLAEAKGDWIAYLDSDNIWHPRFLELMLEMLKGAPGHVSGYASYFDVQINELGVPALKKAEIQAFHLENQLEVPFVDLNSFMHRRELLEVLGGFDERLVRRQDYDLISRFCWIREPLHLPFALNLYQRNAELETISRTKRDDSSAPLMIAEKVESYYREGLPVTFPSWVKKVTVLSWDMSRNHFAKAYCVADALSKHLEVELISFRFFEEAIFQPLADAKPSFAFKAFEGGNFPEFFDTFARAIQAIEGDLIYAVKPRLTSLGLALMANYHTGKPVMLEVNDLETVVGSPKTGDQHVEKPLEAIFDNLEAAKVPHAQIWSQVLDPCVWDVPVAYTHNINLNTHYGRRCLYMRNIKDDSLFDPAKIDRDAVRAELGFSPEDRVILFGGLVRKHKGIFELVELLEKLKDPRYKLLVVGSRETPDLKKLAGLPKNAVTILPPQPPERMAALNYAADLVVLWFDPAVSAGHYQSPYKMSDALAMGPAIVASPISDLAKFAERELLWMVPFGNFDRLVETIKGIFADDAERLRRRDRARKFFLREFSYKSVPPAFALGAGLLGAADEVHPVSARFAKFFAEFEKRCRS